jgi:hypothetical protein
MAAAGIGIEHLRSRSPKHHRRDIASTGLLNILFPNDPLICAGQYFGRPFAVRLSEFHHRFLSRCSFVVPNPMTALTGMTQLGRESARSENNVGPRRWAVIEADPKPDNPLWAQILIEANNRGVSVHDLGAALLLAVSEESGVPLTAVVDSGSVSEHGWFYAANLNHAETERLYQIGAKWGGDPATWTLHQWVRMPNGSRWSEDPDRSRPATLVGPQRLQYFNPNN